MIVCTKCGQPANVTAYGKDYTTAIRVACRVCDVAAVKVGGRRSIVVEAAQRAALMLALLVLAPACYRTNEPPRGTWTCALEGTATAAGSTFPTTATGTLYLGAESFVSAVGPSSTTSATLDNAAAWFDGRTWHLSEVVTFDGDRLELHDGAVDLAGPCTDATADGGRP